MYKNSNEKWRAMSTTKAVQAIKKHPTEIKTYEVSNTLDHTDLTESTDHTDPTDCVWILQEARELPFVGERLANKIYEIISSGHLRRLDNVDKEKEKVIGLFQGIHGVGATTAHQLYAKVMDEHSPSSPSYSLSLSLQGYRTLDDLRERGEMNRVQQIGLRHYDDFNERMLREEVEEIEKRVSHTHRQPGFNFLRLKFISTPYTL